MKKKLISLAVAAAVAAPMAAMADATIYGIAHMSVDNVDVDRNAIWFPPAEQDFNGWGMGMGGRNSRLGFKGSEDLGGGLKAIYKMEFAIPLANEDNDINNGDGNRLRMRNSYVGLAGGWGSLLIGRHDTPAKMATGKLDMFADTLADYNKIIGFADVRSDNTIAYISPNWAGFTLAAATIPGGQATVVGLNNANSDSIAEGWSVAGMYNNGPFFAALSYETLSDDLVGPTAIDEDPEDIEDFFDNDDWSYWKIGLGILDWNGFTLSGVYEDHSNFLGRKRKADAQLWQIQAAYAFGNFKLKGNYGQVDPDRNVCVQFDAIEEDVIRDCKKKKSWTVGADYNFSKRTTAYLLYTRLDDDARSADWKGFSLGMIHKF
jgi:predicted porin